MKKSTLALLFAGASTIAATAGAVTNALRRITFQDRVVVITGGSRGLGLVMARQFFQEGAQLVLLARDSEELARAKQEFGDDRVTTIVCDVTDKSQVDSAFQEIFERLGKIDVLINDAGLIEVGPMDCMTLEDYETSMKIHYFAPLYCILATLPYMRSVRFGRIVNISSIGGRISVPHLLPYSASKHALVGLSQGLRSELLKENILVTTVCPGLMRTGSHVNADFKGKNREEYALFAMANASPLSSVSAETAASAIVEACRFGQADLVISLPAKIAARLQGVFPGAIADVMGVVNATLPGPGGIGSLKAKGRDSTSFIAPSLATILSDSVVEKNNEVN